MTKRLLEPFDGGRVRLRPLGAADLPLTLRWRNQEHIRRWFFDSEPLDESKHRAWYERYAARDDDFVFVIEGLEPRRPVGQAAIYHVDWSAGRAEFGRLMIGEPEAAGIGLAREATDLLVRKALEDWGLSEVYLEVYADNMRARAIYDALGFLETARRDNVVVMNIYRQAGG